LPHTYALKYGLHSLGGLGNNSYIAKFNAERESISRYLQHNKKQSGHFKLAITMGHLIGTHPCVFSQDFIVEKAHYP
jgi:hypothetical protein